MYLKSFKDKCRINTKQSIELGENSIQLRDKASNPTIRAEAGEHGVPSEETQGTPGVGCGGDNTLLSQLPLAAIPWVICFAHRSTQRWEWRPNSTFKPTQELIKPRLKETLGFKNELF